MDFKVFFNKKKQWIEVTLWDVHPTTFANWKGGRWGYFMPTYSNPKQGVFGEIHLVKSRIREDLIVHELFHALTEWMWSNGFTVIRSNEERMAETLDEMVRKFYRELRKLELVV